MKVKDLVAILKQLDQDQDIRVIVDEYAIDFSIVPGYLAENSERFSEDANEVIECEERDGTRYNQVIGLYVDY